MPGKGGPCREKNKKFSRGKRAVKRGGPALKIRKGANPGLKNTTRGGKKKSSKRVGMPGGEKSVITGRVDVQGMGVSVKKQSLEGSSVSGTQPTRQKLPINLREKGVLKGTKGKNQGSQSVKKHRQDVGGGSGLDRGPVLNLPSGRR